MLIHRTTIRGAMSTDGGCMDVQYSGEVTVSDSLLTNCTALMGGGISAFSLSKLLVTNSTISNSEGKSFGGCIRSQSVQEVSLLNDTLSTCLSEGAGAATWISNAETVLIIGTIIENATAPGGISLYQLFGDATIMNTSVLGRRNSIQMEQASLTMSTRSCVLWSRSLVCSSTKAYHVWMPLICRRARSRSSASTPMCHTFPRRRTRPLGRCITPRGTSRDSTTHRGTARESPAWA